MKNWLAAHWQWLAFVVAPVVFSTVLVKWIDFYGDDHPRLKRAFRFLLSLLSLLPARNAAGAGVRLVVGNAEVQIPGVSWSTNKPSQGTRAGSRLGSVGLIFAAVLSSCGTSAMQKIDAANEAAHRLRKAAAPAFNARCEAATAECKKLGVKDPDQCAKWIKCRDARRVFYAVVMGIHLKASAAAATVQILKTPKLDQVLAAILEQLDKARKLAIAAGAL